jgi:hypothetical protein
VLYTSYFDEADTHGSAPSRSTGILLKNGTSLTLSAADATAAKFIGVATTTPATVVNAVYTL